MEIDIDQKLSTAADELRRRAEEQLQANATEASLSLTGDETQRLVHELEVHQIELEMQNSELRLARNEVETELENYTDLYDFAPVGYVTLDRNEIIHAGEWSIPGAEKIILDVSSRLLVNFVYNIV